MVIKPVDDFNVTAISESPVGEVGLPTLVGLVGFEAEIRRLGTLLGFRDDQALSFENAADGGLCRSSFFFSEEVGAYGTCSCVEALSGEFFPQLQDPPNDPGTGLSWIRFRTSRLLESL